MAKSYLKLCSKKVAANGKAFNVYFGYRMNANGNPILTKGETDSYAKSIRVVLLGKAKKYVEDKDTRLPVIFTFDDDKRDTNGFGQFSIKIDKKVDGTVRLDKNGARHLVILINDYDDVKYDKPTPLSFADVDKF